MSCPVLCKVQGFTESAQQNVTPPDVMLSRLDMEMGLAPPHTPTTVPEVAEASADRNSASVPRQEPDVGKQLGFSLVAEEEDPDFFDFICFMPFTDFLLLLPFALSLLESFFMPLLDLLRF